MFILPTFTIKHGSNPSVHQQTNGQVNLCTMELYSPFKRKEILIYIITWEDHKDVVLSIIRQQQKTNTLRFYFLRYLKV